MPESDDAATLRSILIHDPVRWHALGVVRALQLPDCWIGAGFVRNAIWDHLHGRPLGRPLTDIDVLWFDRGASGDADDAIQDRLRALEPDLTWSVKNQAHMHIRNGDDPYDSAVDAMRYWPETATAVAVRRSAADACQIAAPFGLNDLFGLVLRPPSGAKPATQAAFHARVLEKRWLTLWPSLRMIRVATLLPKPPGAM